jgi:protein TonB
MPALIFALAAMLPSSPPPTPSVSAAASCPVQRRDGSAMLATYFSSADYPPEALARGEQGTVCVQMTIGTDGRVRACAVLASSGSARLDETTCRIIRERLRFRPAISPAGDPVEDDMVSSLHWTLPG